MGSLYRRHVQAEAAVTDADAQAFFEQNVAFIQTRFHVLQIFHKGGGIERDQQALQSGVPFEEVAARRFPRLPPGDRAPWDLGELTWSQIPKAWRGVVDRLEPGQVSDVIKGDNERWWVLKLAGKAVDPGITLATERARIGEALRQQKADEVYARLLAERREKASIVYAK
jgi:parvulin-like peptidyl-prolyl isomerase